jgi:putative transposase
MARRLRIQYEGALYHVVNRGNYRRDVFETVGAVQAFVSVLVEAVVRYGWWLHAYVVMQNHFHLAVETPRANLVDGMHWLQGTLATRFNRFRDERGHLFQGRYQSTLVENFAGLAGLVDYIHLNPVRAGIVPAEKAAAFRWSSLSRFVKGPRFDRLTAADWLAAQGGWTDSVSGWQEYQKHLQELSADLEAQKRLGFDGFSRGWALGTTAWRKSLAEEYAQGALSPGIEAQQLRDFKEASWRRKLDLLLVDACRSEAEIARAPKSAPWKVALALKMRRDAGASVTWLAKALQMGQAASLRGYLHKASKTELTKHAVTP